MEEEKKVCCEEAKSNCCGGKEKCEHGMTNCCKNWKKCHMIKMVMIIVVIIIAFCLGSQWGEIKSEIRGNRFERGGRMMNWGENRFESASKDARYATDEVTVKINDATAQATPAVKQ